MTFPSAKLTRVGLRVRRQEGREGTVHYEVFEVALARRLTIAEALDRIALQPVTVARERVSPVAYTWGCAGPGCASCMLLAGGRAVAACETLVEEVVAPGAMVTLEPLAKLGVVRDLLVDGSRLRADRLRVLPSAEVEAAPREALRDGGLAPLSPLALALSRCTRCGACVEACPETRERHGFVGAAAIVASRLADEVTPADGAARLARHQGLANPGGIHECGQAQRCLEACPAGLPLDDVLAGAAGDALRAVFRRS